MTEKKVGKMKSYLFGIILGCSLAVFSIQQMIGYSIKSVPVTGMVAFASGVFGGVKLYEKYMSFIRENKLCCIFLFFVSIIMNCTACTTKGAMYVNGFMEDMLSLGIPRRIAAALNVYRLRYYVISVIAIWCLCVLVIKYGTGIIKDIFDGIPEKEMKAYRIISITFMAIVLIVYNMEPSWYLQYDDVYSIDSGVFFGNIYPDLNYYDIRHPLLGELTFPIWAAVTFMLKLFAPRNLISTLTAVLIQWINIQMLLLVGMVLRKLTGKKTVFYMYLCSFPTLLFVLSLEKYQMCVFLLVLYVYAKCRKRPDSTALIILTAGVMPTNAFLAVLELSGDDSVKNKVMNICKIVIAGVLTLICLGRIFLVDVRNVYSQITEVHSRFGAGTLSMIEKIKSVINMMESSFLAISSVSGEQYLWQSITAEITAVAVLIITLILIGIYFGRREKVYRICAVWVLFAFILFVGFNWATYESPLFSIIFSWAVIPLFVQGLDCVFEKIKIRKQVGYGILLLGMILVNVSALIDINLFFKALQKATP